MSDDTTARAREMVAATPKLPDIDVRERSVDPATGTAQVLEQRLFMQLLVFRAKSDPDGTLRVLGAALEAKNIAGVLYRDANDPRSFGLLTWSVDPAHFVTEVRSVLLQPAFADLTLRDDFSMLGRTYATGYENNLNFWLLDRPVDNAVNPDHRWAVWYPLRRTGSFEQLSVKEQAGVLREHAAIGRAYGEQNLATDIRLACHGLDAKDNEFVIGVLAKELHPLSHLVQRMRRTQQTSTYIQQMGPFFVGYAVWQKR